MSHTGSCLLQHTFICSIFDFGIKRNENSAYLQTAGGWGWGAIDYNFSLRSQNIPSPLKQIQERVRDSFTSDNQLRKANND